MTYLKFVPSIVFLFAFSAAFAQKISTPQGLIKGVHKKSFNGRQFEAYLGIPYAKPPVEELRFKSPVPFGNWNGVRDATKEGSECIQKGIFSGNGDTENVHGQEDCLYLNVFTPSSSKPKEYPVMVFIHGGAFAGGTGNPSLYEPDFLLDKDIVLVTINYRLGALGFASAEDAKLPGNFGLKDQTMALKWIQENIESYGGNPGSVTIFGQSAGGASVHFHLISPLSKGLFHRGISMSGTSHCSWALSPPGVIAKRTKKLASLVGCPHEPTDLLVECMQHIPAYLIVDLTDEFIEWNVDPVILFNPVVEPNEIEGGFLNSKPYDSPTTLPFMTGLTSEDGAIRMALFSVAEGGSEKALKVLHDNFVDLFPISTSCNDFIGNPNNVINMIKKFYFEGKNITKEASQEIINMYTDNWFTQCAVSAINNHKGPAPTYLYVFSHKSEYSTTYKMSKTKEYYGVSHGDELMYLFPSKLVVDRTKGLSNSDKRMMEDMVTLWTNFAIYGNPTPEGKMTDMAAWDPATVSKKNFYNIEFGKYRNEEMFHKRIDFWQDIQRKLYESSSSQSDIKDEL